MIKDIINISRKAGEKILEIYNSKDFHVECKDDKSPLTCADKASNKIICDFLKEKYPDIPILSEENKIVPENEIKLWKRFFLIDPLDGTKDFIKRNGEFTVNIALVENGVSVLGVIYIPVWNELYYAEKGEGAFVIKNNEKKKLSPPSHKKNMNLTSLISRSHFGEEEMAYLKKIGVTKTISVGSSIKFCWLASGKADVYIRKVPLMMWDIGAAMAICNELGIKVRNYDDEEINFLDLTINGIKAEPMILKKYEN